MSTLRSVVYRRGALEHFLVEGERLTLCGREPEHVNPGAVSSMPADDIVAGNYCRTCVRRGREERSARQ